MIGLKTGTTWVKLDLVCSLPVDCIIQDKHVIHWIDLGLAFNPLKNVKHSLSYTIAICDLKLRRCKQKWSTYINFT